MPAVSRARVDSGGPAAVEPCAGSAYDARAPQARVDSRLAAQSAANPARHTDAAILADTAVSEVVLPAAWRRCRSADPGGSRSLNDSQGRPEPAPPAGNAEY